MTEPIQVSDLEGDGDEDGRNNQDRRIKAEDGGRGAVRKWPTIQMERFAQKDHRIYDKRIHHRYRSSPTKRS